MTDFTTTLDFIWNEHSTKLTHHIVPWADVPNEEELVTVCGDIARGVEFGTPEYDLCPDCLEGDH